MAMIKFDHVDKYYGKFHALKNINPKEYRHGFPAFQFVS